MENKEIKLSYFQKRWLDTRGGRNEDDVFSDKDGLFVLMGNGRGGEKKVYLPSKCKECQFEPQNGHSQACSKYNKNNDSSYY